MNSALAFYEKDLAIFDAQKDKAIIATTFKNMAVIYDHKNNHSKFLDCIDKGLHIYLALGDDKGIASVCVNMDLYFGYEKQQQKSVYHYQRAINIYSKSCNPSELSKAYAYLLMIKFDMDSVCTTKI